MPLDIHDIDGPLRVLAGPGTGKTHALVDLYEQAVREGVADRGQILVLTFSNGAAAEIARRIDQRLKDDYGEAWISTFHSFCSRLLREHSPDPERLLLDGFQESMVMRRVLAEMEPDVLGGLAGGTALRGVRPRPADLRRADETEPRPSLRAAAGRRSQRG